MQLTILGSGTMPPTKERNPAGFLVEAGKQKILLDAGHGTIRRLVDFGFRFQDIKLVFISHFHTDHFSDAFSLVHARWVDDAYYQRKNQKLLFLGPAGLKKRYNAWRKIFWPEPNESYPLEFLEGKAKISLGNVKLETFPVKHVTWFPSVGIVINYQGKKLVYTGDIGLRHNFEALVNQVKDADLLITEASFEKPTPNHYSISQIQELVKLAWVKKVLVVHIRPQQVKNVEKICKKDKRFVLGNDGMKLRI